MISNDCLSIIAQYLDYSNIMVFRLLCKFTNKYVTADQIRRLYTAAKSHYSVTLDEKNVFIRQPIIKIEQNSHTITISADIHCTLTVSGNFGNFSCYLTTFNKNEKTTFGIVNQGMIIVKFHRAAAEIVRGKVREIHCIDCMRLNMIRYGISDLSFNIEW